MIRPYKSSDRESLLHIFTKNTPQFFDPKEIRDFENYLKEKPETYLTIESDHNIVGGTGYYINETDHSGRITWIFFDPEYAGKGLGKLAVEYCLKELKKDSRVKKFVVTTSQLAYQFFEKFGYQLIRTEKDYWGKGLDLYEMEMMNDS